MKAGLWFRRGRLLHGLSCPQHYAAFRQISHLSKLSGILEPPLAGTGVERMRIVAEGTEFSLVRYLAAAGLWGVGCSLYASVESDVLAGNLVLIDLDGPPLYLVVRLLMKPQRRLAKPVCDFTDFLRETFAAAD